MKVSVSRYKMLSRKRTNTEIHEGVIEFVTCLANKRSDKVHKGMIKLKDVSNREQST